MDGLGSVVVFLIGLGVVAVTLVSSVQTVVLPRATQSFLTRIVFRASRRVFRVLANERRSFEARDRVMALFAPITLVLLPIMWVILVGLGYTAMFWAVFIRIVGGFVRRFRLVAVDVGVRSGSYLCGADSGLLGGDLGPRPSGLAHYVPTLDLWSVFPSRVTCHTYGSAGWDAAQRRRVSAPLPPDRLGRASGSRVVGL